MDSVVLRAYGTVRSPQCPRRLVRSSFIDYHSTSQNNEPSESLGFTSPSYLLFSVSSSHSPLRRPYPLCSSHPLLCNQKFKTRLIYFAIILLFSSISSFYLSSPSFRPFHLSAPQPTRSVLEGYCPTSQLLVLAPRQVFQPTPQFACRKIASSSPDHNSSYPLSVLVRHLWFPGNFIFLTIISILLSFTFLFL